MIIYLLQLTSYKENTAKKNKKTKSSDSDVEMDTDVQNDTEKYVLKSCLNYSLMV